MKQLQLTIRLQSKLLFSATNQTVGNHHGLDYIPGAAIYGLAAGKLYQQYQNNGASWQVFHSGHARFGNGYPLAANGQVTVPIPASWHCRKGTALTAKDQERLFDAEKIFLSRQAIEPGQPKGVGRGYVSFDGSWLKPSKALEMRTAIDATTGTVAEGQLYGYEHIQPDDSTWGDTFVSYIAIDENVGFCAAELQAALIENLSGAQLLGRSKSAEFGQVDIHITEAPQPKPIEVENGDQTHIHLLSDAYFIDDKNRPALAPNLSLLLGEKFSQPVSIDKSAIKHGVRQRFNGYRRSHDTAIQVLQKGSVLVYDQALSQAEIDRLALGVGLYREIGFGQVQVNSPLVCGDLHPSFEAIQAIESNNSTASSPTVTNKADLAFLQYRFDIKNTQIDQAYPRVGEGEQHAD